MVLGRGRRGGHTGAREGEALSRASGYALADMYALGEAGYSLAASAITRSAPSNVDTIAVMYWPSLM